MRTPSRNALDILAKHTYNEIRIFYDDPKNKKKFEAWKRQRDKRT